MTFGDHNVLARDNSPLRTRTQPPSFKPPHVSIVLTHHGAIEHGSILFDDEQSDLNYRSAFSISDVAIIGNTVHAARFAGIRMGGAVSDAIVEDNALSDVISTSVVEAHAGMDPTSVFCACHTLNGTQWPTRCGKTDSVTQASQVTVSGATLRSSAAGVLSAAVPPITSIALLH